MPHFGESQDRREPAASLVLRLPPTKVRSPFMSERGRDTRWPARRPVGAGKVWCVCRVDHDPEASVQLHSLPRKAARHRDEPRDAIDFRAEVGS